MLKKYRPALLVVTVALHASSIAAPAPAQEEGLDAHRVQMLADQIGGSGARAMAEDIVRQEQRADVEAEQARAEEASRDTVSR